MKKFKFIINKLTPKEKFILRRKGKSKRIDKASAEIFPSYTQAENMQARSISLIKKSYEYWLENSSKTCHKKHAHRKSLENANSIH